MANWLPGRSLAPPPAVVSLCGLDEYWLCPISATTAVIRELLHMPIYEYQCKKCGAVAEVLQKLKDPPPGTCEECGAKKKMERVMSRTSFVLKGEGWYITDYARKGKKDADSGGSSEKTEKSKKDSDKSSKKKDSGPAASAA